MRRQASAVVLATISVVGCSKPPSALGVCQRLYGAGVAANCHGGKPTGPGAAAVESADFELAEVPEHEGTVYRFDTADSYDKALDAFAAAVMATASRRYGSRKALVVVQLSSDTPSDIAANAKAIVDRL